MDAAGVYRAYFIGPDGNVFDRVELLCYDEDDAKAQAKVFAQDWQVELWKDTRMVARYEPDQRA